MTLSKDSIWYEYDVLSRNRQVLILLHQLNVALGYILVHTILFCLFGFIQLMNKLIHVSKKSTCIKTTDNTGNFLFRIIVIMSRHLMEGSFKISTQKLVQFLEQCCKFV